ncbi:MAG TPA: ABC transporter substrate-binding protein [Solirubrobacteraceae bacterium]|jgi:branched-chain amino acid transport system substrate-binding protein
MLRGAGALAAAAAIAVAAAACGSSSSSGSSSSAGTSASAGASSSSGSNASQASQTGKCTARALLITNLTGVGAQNGASDAPAWKLAASRINAAGGVNGCKLVVDIANEASDPTKDVPLAEQYTSQHTYAEVAAIDLGGASAVPYLMRRKILSVTSDCAGEGLDTKANPYFFDTCPGLSPATLAATTAAIKAGHTKIGAVVQNNSLGANAAIGIQQAAKKAGGQVVDVEKVDPTAVDTTAAVTRLQNAGAQAVVFELFGAVVGHFLDNVATSGYNVPLYGGLGTFATNIPAIVTNPKDYQNLLVVGPAVATTPSRPAVLDYIAGLKKTPGGQTPLSNNLSTSGQAYDDLILFAWAANQAHSLNSDTLKKFLETHGTTAVPGLLNAPSTGYTPADHMFTPNYLAVAKSGPLNEGRLKRLSFAH